MGKLTPLAVRRPEARGDGSDSLWFVVAGRAGQGRALSGLDRAETATELRAEGAWQGLKRRVLCARGGMAATAHTGLWDATRYRPGCCR